MQEAVCDKLAAHCGGSPSAVQAKIIDQYAWLRPTATLLLQLEHRFRSSSGGATLSLHDSNVYLAWVNTLTRTLSRLGIEPQQANVSADQRSLAAILTEVRGGDAPPP